MIVNHNDDTTNNVVSRQAFQQSHGRLRIAKMNDDGCGQVIRKTGGGDLIPWGDHNALTYAIRRRLQEGKDSAELQMAQEKIRLHFNWHLIALEVVQFYQAALRRG